MALQGLLYKSAGLHVFDKSVQKFLCIRTAFFGNAHELRTPIAAIRAQAQVALSADTNDQVRQLALQDTLRGCDRASRLVEQLLTLARVDDPQDLASELFRLEQLAQQIMAELAPGTPCI